MPGTTSPLGIPYPLPSEAPNGAAQMLALADKVDDLIVAEQSARAAADTALDTRVDKAEADITTLFTRVPTAKVKWDKALATTNAQGRATIQHNAGWVPSVVMLTAALGGTATKGVGLTLDRDTNDNGSSFVVMAWNLDTGAPYVGQVTVHYILRD